MSLCEKDVLVLAGPSACGKSTLLRELLGDGPVVRQVFGQLGLNVDASRGKLNLQRLVNIRKMKKRSRKNSVDVVLVQFDVLSCYRKQRSLEFEQVVQQARSVTVLTLCTPFEQWHQRIISRLRSPAEQSRSLSAWFRMLLAVGSDMWQPSSSVWRMLMASRLSMPLAHWMYAHEYQRWDRYWRQHKGIRQAYFDSYRGDFLPSLPFCF